ncbi:6738_t:CDS:2, partial [Racocetra fulgida]
MVNVGAIIGGTLLGYLSQKRGRRYMIIICMLIAGAFLPLVTMGAWSIVPAYLIELSPPNFRVTFSGLAYQLGGLIAGSSVQIEAELGKSFTNNGNPNYG